LTLEAPSVPNQRLAAGPISSTAAAPPEFSVMPDAQSLK
jgi:hypothetical protein